MFALEIVVLTLLLLTARSVHVWHRVRGWQPLWRLGVGPCTMELRRHTVLTRLGCDSLEFPQPREFRHLSMRLAGLPLWSWERIASLPAESDARIDAVSAHEFDHLFPESFRLVPPKRAVRAAIAA
jgi:hypothetical protein